MKKLYIPPVLWACLMIFNQGGASPDASARPPGSLYLDGGTSCVGVVLCHGRGKDPDWLVVGPLRRELNSRSGYHTLSLQMPAEKKYWVKYLKDFPAAWRSIRLGIDYLTVKRKVKRIYIIGHSMGSRMSASYCATHHDKSVSGFVGIGMRNNGTGWLNCMKSLENINIPVLDIYGSQSLKDLRSARQRSSLTSNSYTQVVITGANHRFAGHEAELVNHVVRWIADREASYAPQRHTDR